MIGCTSKPKQLYLIREDGKCGFIDSLGNKIIEPSYLFADNFSDGVALVVTDTSWMTDLLMLKTNYHYINEHGKTVGQENYTAYFDFMDWLRDTKQCLSKFSYSEGKALFQVRLESKDDSPKLIEDFRYGYINKKGKVVIPCEYNDGDIFKEGKTMVQETSERYSDDNGLPILLRWKVINEKGENLTDYMFYAKAQFYNNRCLAIVLTKKEGDYMQPVVFVLLDENGNIIKTFSEGGMKKLEEDYIIDEYGQLAMLNMSSKFYHANDGSEVIQSYDMSPAWTKNVSKNRGFLGPLPKDIHISYVKGYSEGLFVCTAGDKDNANWFFTDAHGFLYGTTSTTEVSVFDDALPFSSGLAAVKRDGKWGYINHDFEFVIPCQYDKADSFNGSLAYVELSHANFKIYSYINKQGMPVWQNSKLYD